MPFCIHAVAFLPSKSNIMNGVESRSSQKNQSLLAHEIIRQWPKNCSAATDTGCRKKNGGRRRADTERRNFPAVNTVYIRCLHFAIDQYYMSMSAINLAFAKTLKQLRRARDLTQEELAQRAGLDYKYLQKLEGKDPSSPTLSTLEKLARGLGVSLTELIALIDETQR